MMPGAGTLEYGFVFWWLRLRILLFCYLFRFLPLHKERSVFRGKEFRPFLWLVCMLCLEEVYRFD